MTYDPKKSLFLNHISEASGGQKGWRKISFFFRFIAKRHMMHQCNILLLLPVYKDGDLNYPIVEERVWERNAFHYDNVAKAMLTLFVVSTFEGIDVLGIYV